MLAWKIAPALAAGNTVVLKPAETTPLTALLFCDVVRQAELPPGVVNIVTGDGRTGVEIVKGDVDKIAFTGSTEVGKAIQRELAGTGKRLTLELGGKAANIVFDDCALDQAIEGIVNGIYFNQGHVCCAGSRLFVQESIYEDVVKKLKRRMKTLRVGDPLDKNTDVGAINSRQQLEKIKELVAAGEAEGAEIYQPPCKLPEKGYWFVPTVFTNVAQSYRIAQEEIFGPVLSVLTFRTPDEAVEKANNTPYGLSAGIWTEKGSRILWMAERLRAGVVWANTFNRFDPASPFGGYKESGFGREGGRHGLEPYLEFEDEPPPRQEDLQALHRRRVPALRVRAAPTSPRGRTSRAPRARTSATPSAPPAARLPGLGRRDRVQPRPGPLPRRRDARGPPRRPRRALLGPDEVDRSIDRIVWYAGWADKLAQVLGGTNPVSGPYFNFTIPEPTGVVGILAPDEPALEGLVSASRPAIVGGNATVVVASETHPLAAIELAEVLATSDVPGGVVNILTGQRAELAPWLAGHMDVNALDVTGADGLAPELEKLAAENVKRVVRGAADGQSPWEIAAFLELKTVWHPIGT